MKIKNNTHSTVKWIVVVISLAILMIGGYFGFQYYQKYQADKIYSVGDTVSFPDFKIDITKAEFKPVDLPLDKQSIAKYGNIDKHEDCNKQSKENTWWKAWDNDPEAPMVKLGPSDYNICIRRNNSRDAINKYSDANSQLVVNYKIAATGNIDTSKLKIELIPDSGRKLGNEEVESLNVNQFFPDSAQYKSKDLADALGAPGPMYTSEAYYMDGSKIVFEHPYKPYHSSDLGGDINKGLERTGYIYTDIRKSEHSVDVKVTYRNDTRIVRITR